MHWQTLSIKALNYEESHLVHAFASFSAKQLLFSIYELLLVLKINEK